MFVSSAYICGIVNGDNEQSYNKVVNHLVQIIGTEDKKLFFVFTASVEFKNSGSPLGVGYYFQLCKV